MGEGVRVRSCLSLEILLYLNKIFSFVFFVFMIGIFIYKGTARRTPGTRRCGARGRPGRCLFAALPFCVAAALPCMLYYGFALAGFAVATHV